MDEAAVRRRKSGAAAMDNAMPYIVSHSWEIAMNQRDTTPSPAEPDTAAASMQALWMPFTANRAFKKAPRLLVAAQGMHYRSSDGREVLDGTSGLWCVNAGHGREPIVRAIQQQAARMDYAPPFQLGHPLEFEAAEALSAIAPGRLKRVFFTNSGSESVDTALKIALAYHRARGQGQRGVFIGRERGYHGVGFGGISVGGIPGNRKMFHGALLPHVDHLPHTHDLEHQGFSRGQPEWGAHLADELERLVQLHDASNIAAVIVEPVAGSAGVLVPPRGYLQRLRSLCDRHGLLLVFDEVITGYGRLGAPFAAQALGVLPDIMVTAKAVNNGSVPLGAVFVREDLADTVLDAAADGAIELPHGYTYSGHPLATAATLATQRLYADEGLLERARRDGLDLHFEQALHALRDCPNVRDIRNLGLMGAVELHPRGDAAGQRGHEVFQRCFELGALVRYTGDTIALSPPLIIERSQIDRLADTLRQALRETR